jgi:hypothetical protein
MDKEIVDRFDRIEKQVKTVLDAALGNQKAVGDTQAAYVELRKARSGLQPKLPPVPTWLGPAW